MQCVSENGNNVKDLTLAQRRANSILMLDTMKAALKRAEGAAEDWRVTWVQRETAIGPEDAPWVEPYGQRTEGQLDEDQNPYVTVSASRSSVSEKNGKTVWRRRGEDFVALLAVMLDDVGTKSMDAARSPDPQGLDFFTGKLKPTFVVETSPGNAQIWYVLKTPITDLAYAKDYTCAIIKTLHRRHGIDELPDVNRIARIPFGVNSKTKDGQLKYPDAGGKPWNVRLVDSDLNALYEPDEILKAFDIKVERSKPRVVIGSTDNDPTGFKAFIYKKWSDDALASGAVDRGQGRIAMDCVNSGDHTDGRADGAMINTPNADNQYNYTYFCQHTTCGRPSFLEAARAAGVLTDETYCDWLKESEKSPEMVWARDQVAQIAAAAEYEAMMGWELSDETPKVRYRIDRRNDAPEPEHSPNVAQSVAPENGDDDVSEKEPFESKLGTESGATAEGNGYFPKAEERPCYRVYDAPFEIKKRKYLAGLYFHGVKYSTKDDTTTNIDVHLCSPLRILAETRDRNDSDYGILIEFKTEKGWKKWCVPSAMLVGDATDAKRELTKNGLKINPDDEKELVKYFRMFQSNRKLFSASTTGWDGAASFVLPERVIGGKDIYFQSRSVVAPYGSGGSLEGWKGMAALARGNPLLMLGISASFAGPLLKHLHVSGAGLHFFGDSSTGKSTIARAAVATWGGSKFMRTWNATANGLEGAAVTHTDTLLALDEMGQARDMRDVYEAAYALINGSGRSRAQQNGDVRESKTWRVFLMSNGEGTMSALLQQDDLQAKAGQQVRLLDVPASRKYGAFDDLQGRSSGAAFSDEVSRLAAENYGWAGVAFVERLIVDLAAGAKLGERLDALMPEFDAADGQERRVARAFAMCGLAGELAVGYGIAPWDEGEAAAAAQTSFKAWKAYRPSSKMSNSEDAQILQSLLDGVERFEDTKFSDIRYGELRELEVVEKGEDGQDRKITKSVTHRVSGDRYGYWEAIKDDTPVAEDDTAPGLEAFDEGRVRRRYLLTSSGLHAVTKGFDSKRVIKALEAADALFDRAKDGRAAKGKGVPGKGTVRMYHVDLYKVREALTE
ncbi:uncharacterized protein (DUF927 family) [Paraburkholderia sp. BL6669N2]|uniref:DUF927 domain-containing protein n=1 Tax=Paraburkholderia sp. BL6669N2 TaxID=1938807 RepID=UPI000E27C676|nr:DUF927 domain-containing protein [Paraburkholderia sp. BL6669N2]REG57615.1 uncharacterized protein (DUF927 family) [Paraburkholderia sp. BL6669N2]